MAVNTELVTFLSSPAQVSARKLSDLVFRNPCVTEISEGTYGKTLTVATAIVGGVCSEVVLVKIAKIRRAYERASVIADLKKEGDFQERLFQTIKSFDADGSTTNAKLLIPAPIKLQDEYFFMQFYPNSRTLLDSFPIFFGAGADKYTFIRILIQVASFFALIEERYSPDFRHGDLHMGNILVSNISLIQMKISTVTMKDFFASIIDFGFAEVDGEKPLDVVVLLMMLYVQWKTLYPLYQDIIKIYVDLFEEKVIVPLFAPFMLPVTEDMVNSEKNYRSILDYFAVNTDFRQEWFQTFLPGYMDALYSLMVKANFIHKDYTYYIQTSRYVRTPIKLRSIEVARLLSLL